MSCQPREHDLSAEAEAYIPDRHAAYLFDKEHPELVGRDAHSRSIGAVSVLEELLHRFAAPRPRTLELPAPADTIRGRVLAAIEGASDVTVGAVFTDIAEMRRRPRVSPLTERPLEGAHR